MKPIFPHAFRGPLRFLFALMAAVPLLPSSSFGHGAMHEKIAELNAALMAQPNDAAKCFELAAVLTEHGEWERALAHLARADELAPAKFPTDLVRGQALAAGGRFAEARASLDRFLKVAPGDATARLARARVVSELGDLRQAAEDSAAALAALPQPTPEMVLELANFQAAAGNAAGALATLDGSRAKLGAIKALTLRAVEVECALGRQDAARGRLDAELAAAPAESRPLWLAEKARLLTRTGDAAQARAAWEALLTDLAGRPPLERGAFRHLATEARQAISGGQARPLSSTITVRAPRP